MKNNYYEVALSFADEQREYVKETSEYLTELGIKHFYDFNEQIDLWGKNLTQHLDEIYFKKSAYFIPFISKEYVNKMWTKLELNSALERNIEGGHPDSQQYILPVKFDDIRVPGIPNTIGFIDARKTSPKKLAAIIFEKVRGVPPSKEGNKNDDLGSFPVLENYNEEINKDNFKLLKDKHSFSQTSYVVTVYGEKGLGKKACVQHFLGNKKNVIKILPINDTPYRFASIVHAFNLNFSCSRNTQDLKFQEQIKREVLLYCKRQPLIIYVEKLQEFDAETVNFLLELASNLLHQHLDFKTFLIFEFDSDGKQQLEKRFFQFPPQYIFPIRFSALTSTQLEDYLYQSVDRGCISDKSLSYITKASFGNMLYLNVIINYLRGEGMIYSVSGKTYCKELSEGSLSNALEGYIRQRYDRLDNNLKEVLSKSSIIGNTFKSELLTKPFGIINADELLRNIEKISKLITQPYDDTYAFENLDVYHMIKEDINPQMQKEWHCILAKYYETLYKKNHHHRTNITNEIASLYTIAKHYKHADNYNAAISYYIILIQKYELISDYLHELKAIEDVKDILDIADIDETYYHQVKYKLFYAEAVCYKEMGNFSHAYHLFCECIEYIDEMSLDEDRFEIMLSQAYCLYNDGDTEGALDILLALKEQFEKQNIYDKQYIKILSALASVYDSTGQKAEEKTYFIEALNYYKTNQCTREYYNLLRKASMVFGEELAIAMYDEAEKNFRKEHSIRCLAEVLHNKATDLMYIGKTNEAVPVLEESIKLFDTYGSQSVHYPLNTKGILKMLSGEYEEAIDIFESALNYNMETFSKITLNTNILNCLNIIKKFSEAEELLRIIDSYIDLPESQSTPVYAIYHHLNWAYYYYHLKDLDEALCQIKLCEKLHYMEPRYRFVCKTLKYNIKKAMGKNSRNTAGTAPNKILNVCVQQQFYFTTVRFYE